MKPLDDMLYNSLELAKQYKAQGVVLYFLKFCPCYSMMLKKYNEIFKKENIPVLIVSSDYSHGDDGQIKIRIEAFLEMLSEGVY
jgi:benzoyl-CoA reductase/2-hydroxyglutaryl-CoA dehydratase subunit BcrC/BadD/HgdB